MKRPKRPTSLLPLLALALAPSLALAQLPDPPIPGIPGMKGPLPAQVPMTTTPGPGGLRLSGGGLVVDVGYAPFSLHVRDERGLLLETATGPQESGFAPAAFTRNDGFTWNTFYWGYRGYFGVDRPWVHGTSASLAASAPDRVTFALDVDHPLRGRLQVIVGPFWEGAVRIAVTARGSFETVNRTALTFRAPASEHYVGFGERFNSVDQRGRIVQSWAEEGSIELGWLRDYLPFDPPPEYAFPAGITTSYAPIPFFISNGGYGALAEVPEPTYFDLCKSQPDMWRIQAESDQLSLVVFRGPQPADVLERYTARTGRSLVPRPWMFAPWNQMSNYQQGGSYEVARMFRELDIPSTVHGGAFHFLPGGDERGREAALAAENRAYHALGYKTWCYFNPRIDKDLFATKWAEGEQEGYFVKAPDGSPYELDVFGSQWFKVSIVDYTNPDADLWYQNLLSKAILLGFDGWMYDFGEYVPPDALFSDGRDGHHWHNAYPLIYERSNARYFEGLDDDPTDEWAPDYVFYHRSAYAGSQAWSWAMWGGDASCSWFVADGLPAAVTGGINLGLSGLPFWGSDIGGYHAILVDPTDVELLGRWMEFGTFCGLMRDETGGLQMAGTRTQILDDPVLTAVVRRHQKLRTQLVPYLVNAGHEAHETGLPVMRAPLLHYGDDPEVWTLKREFLCGRDLYVAPVVEKGATTRTLYLPAGDWVELFHGTEYDETSGGFRIGGRTVDGGRTITVDAPFEEIPLFVRPGSILPMADPRVDTFFGDSTLADPLVTSHAQLEHLLHAWAFPFPGVPTRSARFLDGSTLALTTDGAGMHLTRTGASDQKELWVQILWPAVLSDPVAIPGLTLVPGADPLQLQPGTWTWSAARGAAAFHAKPGQLQVDVLTH